MKQFLAKRFTLWKAKGPTHYCIGPCRFRHFAQLTGLTAGSHAALLAMVSWRVSDHQGIQPYTL